MMRPRRIAQGACHPRRWVGPNDTKASSSAVLEPTDRELRVVALHQAVPFVGFGMMDNSILILAGEAIDINLGVTLGISTMCAAAIGNIGANLVRREERRDTVTPTPETVPLTFVDSHALLGRPE
jgi:hypothetical protein